MKLYQRGQTWGVIRTEMSKPTKSNPTPEPKEVKYRLNTLGIDFEERLREWERQPEMEKVPASTVAKPTLEVPQKLPPTPQVVPPLPPEEKIAAPARPELSLEEKRLRELQALRKAQKLKKERNWKEKSDATATWIGSGCWKWRRKKNRKCFRGAGRKSKNICGGLRDGR